MDEKDTPPKKQNRRRARTSTAGLTALDLAYCELRARGCLQSDAAQRLGLNKAAAQTIEKLPKIRAQIAKISTSILEAQAASIAKDYEEEIGELKRKRGIDRSAVLLGLADLAKMSPDKTNHTISGQVRAYAELAEILGMKVQYSADVTKEFEGRTEEELVFYGAHGYWPTAGSGSGNTAADGDGPARSDPKKVN